jgi:flagellar L-ring protein precursor FlgH
VSRYLPYILVAGFVCLPGRVRSDSLWDRRNPYSAYLFVDTRARHVGDLVTILLNETTDIEHREDRNLDKQTTNTGVFGFVGKIAAGKLGRDAAVNMNSNLSNERQVQGKAEFTADRRFNDRMTATVVGVLPNGNLIIEGMRMRVLTGEERMLRIRGVIRPMDIASDNTIRSQFIAEFQVLYEGKGPESSFSSQGWWSKKLNSLWPF